MLSSDTAPPSQLHEGGFKAFIAGCTIINNVRQIKIDASLHLIFTAFFGGISAVQSCSKKYIFGYKNAIYQELYFDISMGIEIYKQPVIIAIPDHTSNWINKCFAFNVASKSSWIFFKKMLHRKDITNLVLALQLVETNLSRHSLDRCKHSLSQ